MNSEVDVLIIGAAPAGLSAAKKLAQVGLTYKVLERSQRGGCAYSEKLAPDSVKQRLFYAKH